MHAETAKLRNRNRHRHRDGIYQLFKQKNGAYAHTQLHKYTQTLMYRHKTRTTGKQEEKYMQRHLNRRIQTETDRELAIRISRSED